MQLASHPGCYAWNPNLQANETVTWSGECADGPSQGTGTLSWESDVGNSFSTGLLRDGTRQGHWVLRSKDGGVYEGPYVDGEKHGHWVEREADGTTETATYINGEKQ